MKRVPWIDVARGIGILAVVYGHVRYDAAHYSIYTWHMPLFYFLSGFLYRTQGTFAEYARHRARQLLVPYAWWLGLVMLPTFLGELLKRDWHAVLHRFHVAVYGGYRLAGPTTAFWFITSLYLALVAYDALSRRAGRGLHAVVAASFVLACLRSRYLFHLHFFWEADAVLIALPFIHVGTLARRHGWAERPWLLAGGAAAYLGSVAYLALTGDVPSYDIKAGYYGVPGLSFVLALAGIAAVVVVSKAAGPLTEALAYVGRASLLIVLTHTAIMTVLGRATHLPIAAGFLVILGVPLALYAVLRRAEWARRHLLGEVPAERRATAAPPGDEPLLDEPQKA